MTVVSFSAAYRAKHGREPTVRVTKQQLARMMGRTPRWVEIMVREGMPAEWDHPVLRRKRLFDPAECEKWLKGRAA